MDKKILETIRQQASAVADAQSELTRTIRKQIICETERLLDATGVPYDLDKDVQEFYKDEANTEAWKITDHTETIDYIFEDYERRLEHAISKAAEKAARRTVEAWY